MDVQRETRANASILVGCNARGCRSGDPRAKDELRVRIVSRSTLNPGILPTLSVCPGLLSVTNLSS